ncbi:MAG: beta-lactamase family protein [Gemmatimonadetes bacterium]|nr:beta-lactamase family protein [Gemmatimonadota bacterium]
MWQRIRSGLLLAVPCASPAFGQGTRAPAAPRCFARDFQAEVRSAIAGYAKVAGIPGVSFGVVVQDALVFAAGVGYANVRRRIPATADTPYNVASVTKLFTSTLALQLAAEGRLDLDAPVARYLPDSVRLPTDASGTAITVRHLLTHTAGLPKQPPNRRNQSVAGPIDPGVWDAYEVADLYQALPITKLRARPGTAMEYSNYGYALLGHVVERVAGVPYEQQLRVRLLTPLGMTSSGITLTAAQAEQLAAFYWDLDDARAEQSVHAHYGSVAGFIGLTSTVRDLSRFLMAHLGTTAAGRAVIAPDVARRMAEPQVQLDSANATHRVDMALGWFQEAPLASSQATPLLWHFGNVDGHASAVFLQPKAGLGVIVLQNLGGEMAGVATEQIGRWLMQRTAAEVARCPPAPR